MRIWKKVLAAVTAGVMLAVGVPQMQFLASAEDTYTYGDLTYTIDFGGGIRITDCDESVTSIIVPELIDGRVVTTIGNNAFSNCTLLEEVELPDSIYKIGGWAFGNCESLSSIDIPDTVSYVSCSSFDGSGAIETIDGINYVDKWLLECTDTQATTVTVRDGTIGISQEAFRWCNDVIDVDLPDSIMYICMDAFSDTSLYNSQEPIKYVDNWIVGCDSSITELSIEDGVVGIADYVFAGANISSINLPDSFKYCNRAFANAHKLTSLNVSDYNSYFTSEGNILYNKEQTEVIWCSDKGYFIIPNTVKRIKETAISSYIDAVFIPKSVEVIECSNAFGPIYFEAGEGNKLAVFYSGMPTTIKYYYNIVVYDPFLFTEEDGEMELVKCVDTSLTEAVIPEFANGKPVTSIGESAFLDCVELTSISLPQTLKTIKSAYILDGKESVENIDDNGWYKINSSTYGQTEIMSGAETLQWISENSDTGTIEVLAYTQLSGLTLSTVRFSRIKSMIIPENVTEIAEGTFYYYKFLEEIYFENPECDIKDTQIPASCTIYGYVGSTAQAFAAEQGCEFRETLIKSSY